MYPVSDQLLRVIRAPHTRLSVAKHRNLVTNVLTELPIVDGTVTVDNGATVRRSLTLTAAPWPSVWAALDTPGGEITVTQYVRYINGTRETVPLGVFIVDQDSFGYRPDGNIGITAPDRSLKVQRNRFGSNRASVANNAAWQEIKRLVEACWGGDYPFPGWATLDESATTKVGSLLWDDGDRGAAVEQLCVDNGVQFYFDALGQAVLEPIPELTDESVPVWTVDASSRGVLVGADRTRDRSRVRNAVRLSTSATDVTFTPVLVQNTTSGDPYNVNGPLGQVVYDYASPTLRNSTQALAAGRAILTRQLGVAKQLSLESSGNPALDADDVIRCLLPPIDVNQPRPSELHIIDSVTHPLAFSSSTAQQIQTRSTRPDTDGS